MKTYKVGTVVPFAGTIKRVDKYNYGELKGKTIYIIVDEFGVETRLEAKNIRRLIED